MAARAVLTWTWRAQVTSEEGKAKRLFELSAALVGLNPTDLSPLSSGAREPAFVQ
jgi:hypothetical protein